MPHPHLIPCFVAVLNLVLPVRGQDEPPRGPWIEELTRAEPMGPGDLPPSQRAEIQKRTGAPALACVRTALDGRTELDELERAELIRAVLEDGFARCAARAARAPRPDGADPQALAVWLYFRGDREAALECIDALQKDDPTPNAKVLRLLAQAERGGIDGETLAAFGAARELLVGPYAVLALHTDMLVAARASEHEEMEYASMARGGDTPYEAPDWAYEAHPSADVAAKLTRLDPAASAAALAAAQEISDADTSRAEEALALFAEASAADVLAEEPWFARARWHNLRGEPELALDAIDAGLARAPLDLRGWRMRAATSDALGDTRAALLAAERGLELQPGDPVLERLYVSALVRLGRFAEAFVASRELALEDPHSPWPVVAEIFTRSHDDVSARPSEWRARLERALREPDDRARLWSATLLSVLSKRIDERALVLLSNLATYSSDVHTALAASTLLDDAPGVPLWSGFARLVRGDRSGALDRWLHDAAMAGEAAVAARGLLESFRATSGWSNVPELPDFATEPLVWLPDPRAIAIHVPGEAKDLARALDALPQHARRIVLGRGVYLAPEVWTRGADVVGMGSATTLRPSKGDQGTLLLKLPRGETLRLSELSIDTYVKVDQGELFGRRIASSSGWWVGNYDRREPIQVRFEDSQFRESFTVHGELSALHLEGCIFDNPFANHAPLDVFLGRATLVRCIVKQSVFHNAPLRVSGSTGQMALEDCRVVGHVPKSGELRPVADVRDGARASFVRTRIVDLDPVADEFTTAEDCDFQRTQRHAKDLPGWTAHGHAPHARRADLAPLEVPKDHPTLAAALLAAEPGRTIQLGPGAHFVEGELARDVVIVGAHTNTTVVQVAPGARGLVIVGAKVTFHDLQLVGSGLNLEFSDAGAKLDWSLASAQGFAPPIASVRDGTLSLGANVHVRDPRGIVFEVGPGGAVLGSAGVWLSDPRVEARVEEDGVVALEIDHELRRFVDTSGAWEGLGKNAATAAHRPFALAFAPDPAEQIERVRGERLARLDALLGRGWPQGGPEFLADALDRVYALAPEGQGEDAMFARLEPRFSDLARSDARTGVEDVIALAMIGIGNENTIEDVLRNTRRVVRAFFDHVPAHDRVYVEARLQGMNAAQADVQARVAQCFEARDAGRAKEALALAEGLDPKIRAEILTSTDPKRLTWSEIDRLLYMGGLGAPLERRLRILKQSYFADSPTGPAPLPAPWDLWHHYINASTTGIGNRYFAFRETSNSYGHRSYDTVLRPEFTQTGPQRPPRPASPPPGSPEPEWDRWYDALEAWAR